MSTTGGNILAFPKEVQKLIGDELQLIQFGEMPKDAKPFKGVGSGVFEIALKYDKEAYRGTGSLTGDAMKPLMRQDFMG